MQPIIFMDQQAVHSRKHVVSMFTTWWVNIVLMEHHLTENWELVYCDSCTGIIPTVNNYYTCPYFSVTHYPKSTDDDLLSWFSIVTCTVSLGCLELSNKRDPKDPSCYLATGGIFLSLFLGSQQIMTSHASKLSIFPAWPLSPHCSHVCASFPQPAIAPLFSVDSSSSELFLINVLLRSLYSPCKLTCVQCGHEFEVKALSQQWSVLRMGSHPLALPSMASLIIIMTDYHCTFAEGTHPD